ncbi:hypothetical protein BGW80DRAFT_1269495, partial [Lactifluus volemus]
MTHTCTSGTASLSWLHVAVYKCKKEKLRGDRPGAQYSVATRGASDAAQSVPSSRSHQTVTISQL